MFENGWNEQAFLVVLIIPVEALRFELPDHFDSADRSDFVDSIKENSLHGHLEALHPK